MYLPFAVEVEKLLAEVEHLYAQKQTEMAEARKINAEAESIEFDNKIKLLKFSLNIIKVFTEQDDFVLFKKAQNILESLDKIEKGENL